MVYTTKFHRIGMFKLFIYGGTVWIKNGHNHYTNGTNGTNFVIPTLGTAVIQLEDSYAWTT